MPYEIGMHMRRGPSSIHRDNSVLNFQRAVYTFARTHRLDIEAIRVRAEAGWKAGYMLVTFRTMAMAAQAAQTMSTASIFAGQQLLDEWQERAALEEWTRGPKNRPGRGPSTRPSPPGFSKSGGAGASAGGGRNHPPSPPSTLPQGA